MRLFVVWVLAVGLGCGTLAAQSGPAGDGLHFQFREPRSVVYELDPGSAAKVAAAGPRVWLRARPRPGATNAIELGSRVVLGVASPAGLPQLLAGTGLRVDRVITSNLFVLQAPDALAAAQAAQRLAGQPGVRLSHPVRRGRARLQGPYAYQPNDPYFPLQWHLENRDTNTAARLGPDLNARAAWPYGRGAGLVVADADDGIEETHPDLAANMTNAYHYDYATGLPDGNPIADTQMHGTAVAGIIAAVGNNNRGVVGVAPEVQLASWVIFDSLDNLVSEEAVMDMFQSFSNVVAVQNHSWGNADVTQLPLGALEDSGISNAVFVGRSGLGEVLARAEGNGRTQLSDGNDDGYAQDPRVIAVAAVRDNGRAASFSNPGANVLVAAFSGDDNVDLSANVVTNYTDIATTDRQGALGYNTDTSVGDQADYAFGPTGFSGTSAASPQVAGLCALVLQANPHLTFRDVQQVVLLSARQVDLADPDLRTNQAGFLVSHNTGFGIPDAAQAVRVARGWSNRPAPTSIAVTNSEAQAIPDDGLRVLITGGNVPTNLVSIPAFPSDGLHPDDPTASLPLVDVGQALTPLTVDLHGKAALIQRGVNYFVQKVTYAVAAGAAFAIIYNNVNGDERIFINGADFQFLPIPTVFISQNEGDALAAYLQQNPGAQAQLRLNAISYSLPVNETLLCEHVAVRVQGFHPRRADLRLTLVSPAGTRSVLQHFNDDVNSAFQDWTYYTTHDFYESSFGAWRLEVSDEQPAMTGTITNVTLTVTGVPITDTDHDGLDDRWELAHFGTLAYGPRDDVNGDGYTNMREYLLGRDPAAPVPPPTVDLSLWNPTLARLSWSSTPRFHYTVERWLDHLPLSLLATNLPGLFPEAEWFVPYTNLPNQFFQVAATTNQVGTASAP